MDERPIQESLLPGTRAIEKGTMECVPYQNRWLVRWKDQAGYAHQEKFLTCDEAHTRFIELVNQVRAQLAAQREPL